jgi:hypothetical protein
MTPVLLLVPILCVLLGSATALGQVTYFSTEEDFKANAGYTDGNPIISDGDLLRPGHVYMRNQKLLSAFRVRRDLGLDAAHVADVEKGLVAFSTELDDPRGKFSAGDLLVTNGAVIPNAVLLTYFGIRDTDLGLDAVFLKGQLPNVVAFLHAIKRVGPSRLRDDPRLLLKTLEQFDHVDIWFSTEGTPPPEDNPPFLDGDLLRIRTTPKILTQETLLPSGVPAGIPARGVDFGLDAMECMMWGDLHYFRFSTEILYENATDSFTDGDLLRFGIGFDAPHKHLIQGFEPETFFFGLDAMSAIYGP